MSAKELASLLHGRRTGPGRYVARCPGHRDKLPSLSIRDGDGRRTLVYCHAGCPTETVLQAVGLEWDDLFDGSQFNPEQMHRIAAERAEREERARQRRIAHGVLCDRIRTLERVVEELSARLAECRDDQSGDEIARLYHESLSLLRDAEAAEIGFRL